MIELSPTVLAVFAASLAAAYFLLSKPRNDKLFPPSPRALPLIGHTHLLSGAKYTWKTLHEISKGLGNPDLMYLKLGTSDVIVINSAKAQTDLLEKKGGIYSDRPRMVVPTELISNNKRTVLMYYGEKWRKLRRFLHSVLFDKAAQQYEPVQEREAKALLLNLLEDPKDVSDHLQLFSSNVILQTTFNRRATSVKDRNIQDLLYDVSVWMLSANPGYHPVHDFPFLDYLPNFLAPWRAYGKGLHDFELKLYNSLSSKVREEMARGESPDVIMRYCLERKDEFGMDDEDCLYLAGTLFEAGSDTTTSLLITLFLVCAANPDLCRKAQEEVDRVIGKDRMPSFADYGQLPYCEALGLELQRFRPAVPSAVPHCLTEDDVYQGYYIPKGATVIGNTWAIGRDPTIFADGDDFRPDRYMPGAERDKIFKALPRGHTGFGHGRRICSGLSLAERSLHIAIASIFWAFDVLPPASGITPDQDDFTSGFVSHSRPFDVLVRPRSNAKAEMIKSEGNLALSEMTSLYA